VGGETPQSRHNDEYHPDQPHLKGFACGEKGGINRNIIAAVGQRYRCNSQSAAMSSGLGNRLFGLRAWPKMIEFFDSDHNGSETKQVNIGRRDEQRNQGSDCTYRVQHACTRVLADDNIVRPKILIGKKSLPGTNASSILVEAKTATARPIREANESSGSTFPIRWIWIFRRAHFVLKSITGAGGRNRSPGRSEIQFRGARQCP
jgi:hypothetical protein